MKPNITWKKTAIIMCCFFLIAAGSLQKRNPPDFFAQTPSKQVLFNKEDIKQRARAAVPQPVPLNADSIYKSEKEKAAMTAIIEQNQKQMLANQKKGLSDLTKTNRRLEVLITLMADQKKQIAEINDSDNVAIIRQEVPVKLPTKVITLTPPVLKSNKEYKNWIKNPYYDTTYSYIP